MQVLFFLIFVIVIFLFSIPLHELFHVIAIRCLGNRDKLKITWFHFEKDRCDGSIEFTGHVGARNEDNALNFPDQWYTKNQRLIHVLFGLSGGLGAAFILICIGTFFLLKFTVEFFPNIWASFFFVAAFEIFYGVGEGLWQYNNKR